MATKTFHEVLTEVRRQGDAHAIMSDISVMVRALGIAERRSVEALEAPRLADIVLALAEIKKGLEPIRQMAASTDSYDRDAAANAKFVLGEIEWLEKAIQKNLDTYVRHSGDAMVYAKGNVAWATAVMKAHRAALAADEQRRAARAAGRAPAAPQKHGRIVADDERIQHFPARNLPVARGKAAPKPVVKLASRRVVAEYRLESGRTVKYTPERQLEIDAVVDRMNNAR